MTPDSRPFVSRLRARGDNPSGAPCINHARQYTGCLGPHCTLDRCIFRAAEIAPLRPSVMWRHMLEKERTSG